MVKSFCLFFLLFQNFACISQQLNLYFLVVGSEHYEQNPRKFLERGFVPYDNLPEANASAKIMQKVLTFYGRAKGITLLSLPNRMISKASILRGIDSLKKLITKDNAKDILIVIYYCGHGISENISWNQFFVPGTYTLIPGTKKIDALTRDMIHLGEITDKLDNLKYHYMVLADCCRKEEADSNLPEARLRYFFDEKKLENLKGMVEIIKFVNEYHQPNPVVFSIEPGKIAPTVDVQTSSLTSILSIDTTTQVGPICRRILLTLERARINKQIMTLKTMIASLTDPALDNSSPVSKCYYRWEEDVKSGFILFKW